MNSAKVLEQIVDLSGRVGSAPGVHAFIQLPGAKKGPINQPRFISTIDELLNLYTTEGTIKPSDNLAFLEAVQYLSRANKLYVNRPDNGAAFGGLMVPEETPATPFKAGIALVEGQFVRPSDLPEVRVDGNYYFEGDVMRPSLNAKFKFECIQAGTASSTGANFNVVTAAEQEVEDGSCVWKSVPLNHPTKFIYQVVTAGQSGAVEPNWETAAEEGQTITIEGGAVLKAVAKAMATPATESERDPEVDHVFGEETMFIHGKYPGKDNDNIGVRILNYKNFPNEVKEEDAFIIEVYYRGTGVALESFTCSRDMNKKDGFGANIYVENAVAGSNYINVLDNPAIDSSVCPVDITEVTYLGGGYDGQELVTDGMMMAGADLINNKATFPIKLLLDGGWTTPNYQRKLDAIAASRKDCLALLSTPLDGVESSAAFVQAIVNYRKNELNLNSYWSAMYTPHIQIYDQYNDRKVWLGASSTAAGKISEISTNIAPWYPPAGLNRGVLNEVTDVRRRFNEPQMDLLCDSQINPVAFFTGEGVVLWGNQTLYSRPSALQSLNVMLLITTVMPEIAKALKFYLFEFNDDDTRGLIKTMVTDYMNTVKTNKGVYDFQVSVHASDDDIDNGRLYVDLIIKPALAINEIRFRLVPIKTGASFSTTLQILEG